MSGGWVGGGGVGVNLKWKMTALAWSAIVVYVHVCLNVLRWHKFWFFTCSVGLFDQLSQCICCSAE